MDLFMRQFNNKAPKKYISFVKKDTIKKLELNYKKQNLGRPLDQLLREMPPLGVCWILEVPFAGGHEAYYVKTNRPQLNTQVRDFTYGRYGYEQPMVGRYDWSELYVEFDNWSEGRRLTEWFQSTMDGRTGYVNSYKKNMTLTLRDRTGVLEQWHLVGCFPSEIRYHQDMVSFNQPDEIICGVSFRIDHARISN
jgi:hypothetical protein